MFNPRPTIAYLPLIDGRVCAVVDDFLLDPQQLIDYAVSERSRFAVDKDNYYPGHELALGPSFAAALEEFLMLHVRRALGARRILHTSARLAMATAQPSQLSGLQRLCHRDAVTLPGNEGVAASVAYLFKAPEMGGTSFYVPNRPAQETAQYLQRVADGSEKVPAAYLSESNDWFTQLRSVPARFNRAIFYDGTLFHAAQITRPDLLTDDPQGGRLTVNGFFRFRKNAI